MLIVSWCQSTLAGFFLPNSMRELKACLDQLNFHLAFKRITSMAVAVFELVWPGIIHFSFPLLFCVSVLAEL